MSENQPNQELFVVRYSDGTECVCDCLSMAQIRSMGEEKVMIDRYVLTESKTREETIKKATD